MHIFAQKVYEPYEKFWTEGLKLETSKAAERKQRSRMNENNQIIIYQTEDGQTQVDVRMENDTVYQQCFQGR